MSYRRAVLIYNPAAGRRRDLRQHAIEDAVALIGHHIESVEARPTQGPHSATELAREACQSGADLVLACGGDGTVNEVLNGIVRTAVPLGVLPAGTGNVLAFELGLPRGIVAAARELPQWQPRRIALGRARCGDPPSPWRYFLLMAGVGLDAHIVYTFNQRLKNYLGILSYWMGSFGQLGRRQTVFEVEFEGRRFECTFALVSRSSQYGGGLRIARGANLLTSELELVLFHTRSSLRYIVYLAGVATGTLRRFRDVTFLRGKQIAMQAPGESRVYVQVDGEYAGRLPTTIEIAPDALTLLMPARYIQVHG